MRLVTGRRFQEVRADGRRRVLEVLYTFPDPCRGERARCRLVEGVGRARPVVSVVRLLSPALWVEVST